MADTVKGLILRETPYGESDKILTVLSAEHGRLAVYARGAKRLKSPLFTPTQLFSYSELTFGRGMGNMPTLATGELIESFYHMRDTLEGTALAGYLADIAADIAQEEQNEENLLRLSLNCFHIIATQSKSTILTKAVFELRAVAEAGFMPNLVACSGCGKSNLDTFYFDVQDGVFRCEDCFRTDAVLAERAAGRQSEADAIYLTGGPIALLSPSVFAAMRYVLYSKPERIFSFELKDDALREFATVCEQYLLCHLERNFSTLDFYHTISADTCKKKT